MPPGWRSLTRPPARPGTHRDGDGTPQREDSEFLSALPGAVGRHRAGRRPDVISSSEPSRRPRAALLQRRVTVPIRRATPTTTCQPDGGRSMSSGAGTSEAKRLLYPTYLDVPMLIDFVASLDDGVSFSSEVAEKIDRGRKGAGEANGSAGLPSIASLLGLNLSASGKLSRERTEQETAESKFVRQHTAASLFNRFHSALSLDAGLVEISTAPELASVSAGDLASCKGVVLRNPLEALLGLYRDIRPVMVVIQRQQA